MNLLLTNKNASYSYFFIEHFVAGIKLSGSDVKAIKQKSFSINEAYCEIINNELYIKKMYVSEYKNMFSDGLPTKDRKLLLKRREIDKLIKSIKERGTTIIPTNVWVTDSGYIKVGIALSKGKKAFDKKEKIKENDIKRQNERNYLNN
jgi:SsrA-binding protein